LNLFTSVVITEGTFPGGDFIYKSAKRDYAAAPSLERQVASDLGLKPKQTTDIIYTIFLDHPNTVPGGRNHRFASGLLASKKLENSDALKQILLDWNEQIQPPTRADVLDLPATDLWKRLRYKQETLPSVKAAIAYFPFTNGFVSSLIQNYKIIPKLRAYAEQHSDSPADVTLITTCSIPDEMCTHFVPLEKGGAFLLGQPNSQVYVESLPKKGAIDVELLKRRMNIGMKKLGVFFGRGKKEEATTTATPTTTDEL